MIYFARMSSRLLWVLSILALLCPASRVAAQGRLDWMTTRNWRIQSGLPDQVIESIVQTPDHYLWLGTKLGLVRFDGYHFLDYGADLAPALHDFGVDCILVAQDGTLWVGTQGGGTVHLFPGGVRTYNASSGLASGMVRALYQDAAGRIWAGADHGLFRLDSSAPNAFFTRVDDTVRTPNLGVHALVGDGRGGVWVAGSRLLHFDNPSTPSATGWQEFPLPREASSVRVWSLAMGPGNNLWVATLGGLYRIPNGGKGTAVRETRIPGSTLSLHVDGRHQLWVGTMGDGLYLLAPDGSLAHVTAPDQLASNSVLALAEDRSHDLWVGTQSGLTRFSDTGMHLMRIPGAIDSEFGSVAVDNDHSLWVCSRHFIHIQGDRQRVASIPSISGVAIRSVLRERSGAFWIGTLGNGAYRIAPDHHIDHYSTAIGTNYIRGFLETPADGVWIASDGGVANWHNGKLTSFQDAPGAPLAETAAMAPGAPGELWVGTYHGLSLLRNGAFVETAAAKALGGHMVWALHTSADGALWIGTDSGLFRWKNGSMQHIAVESEMGSPAVLAILEDHLHRIWLGGPTAVLRAARTSFESASPIADSKVFNPEVFAFSRETGAELSAGAASTAELDGFGGAWFATNEGPLHIQATDAARDGTPPPLMLGEVLVDGQRVDAGVPLVLQPSAKTLELNATPIVLSARPGLRLRRRLIGFDTQWTKISSTQPATYTNLPPGHYIYRVEASWKDSSGTTALEIPITQLAHFYRRPAFLVACVVLLLLLIWAIHRLRVRRVTLRFLLVAEERNRVAREMHDTVVQGCVGVSSLLEAIAIRQPQGEGVAEPNGAAELLDTAREQIAITILEARSAIWGLRHPQADGDLSQSLHSILDRMTAIQNTSVEFESEGFPVRLESEIEHELLMTTREALHNAVVHAAPQHIHLSLRYAADSVTIRIHDDGSGFVPGSSTQDRGEHFGLLGMHERMGRVGGSCMIDSGPDRGTMVVLEMPLSPAVRSPQETR